MRERYKRAGRRAEEMSTPTKRAVQRRAEVGRRADQNGEIMSSQRATEKRRGE
jgi:hypothetical protein